MITRDKLNSRKLALTVFMFASCCGLLASGQLESGDFTAITIALIGAYSAARAYVDGKQP